MDDSAAPGDAPHRIDAEKVAYFHKPEIAGNITVSVGERSGERVPVHKPPRNLPPRQETFAGRASELRELHERLSASSQVGITQQTAVHGHGGVGKTSIAIEYGWLHLEDSYPGGVFFLSCEASPGAPPLDQLAPHLGVAAADTVEETAQRVKLRLETGEPSLLILDNVRGSEQVRAEGWARCLPGGACRRLITTRAERLPGVRMYRLDRLTREDGLLLLAEYREDAAEDAELASSVVEWFDGLAVGLTLVGVYMQMHPRLSWKQYVDSLDTKGLGAVRGTEQAVEEMLRYQQRVDAVFDDLLGSLPAAERRALEYAALLPEDNVYAPWLPELLKDDGVEVPELPGYDDRAGDRVVESLVDRQLLRARGEDALVLGLHRVLRRRASERLADEGIRDVLLDRVVELAERRGEASHTALTAASVRRELTPLAALTRELLLRGRLDAAVSLVNWIFTPLRDLGRYTEARRLLDQFASIDETSGVAADEIAILYTHVALILKDLGELGEARHRMERAIEIEEQHFDADHPTLATSYSNLALILQNLGELREARRRMERAIEIDEQHFDADHPTLATSYSNLALILRDLGEVGEARRRTERAIKIWEQHFNPDHPTLATSYSNLAMILQDLGELGEARRRMERAIEIQEQHFDPDHPTLATRYNNLAHIEMASGNPDVACALFRRSLAILQKHFADNHPYIKDASASIKRYCGNGDESPGRDT